MGLFGKNRNKQVDEQKPIEEIPGFKCTDNGYSAAIDGVTVEFGNGKENLENAAFAKRVASAYSSKLPVIVEHLLSDDGFQIFFPNVTAEDLPTALGQPTIKVSAGKYGIISYINQTLDDMHIIDIEFSEVIEQLSDVNIDG